MSKNEAINVTARGKEYRYSDKDLELHGEMSSIAQKTGGDSIIIEVFFFLSTEKELGIYLYGPKDPAIIEKMNCGIINGEYKNSIPPTTYILYYDESDEGALLTAIKSEK